MGTIQFFEKPGRELDRLLENSSRPNVTYHIWFQSKKSNG